MRAKGRSKGLKALASGKGQAAIETLILIGFMIAAAIPLIMIFWTTSNMRSEDVSVAQAKLSSKVITDMANQLCLQGAGAQRIIIVNYPQHLKNISIEGREVTFVMDTELPGNVGRNEVVSMGICKMEDAATSGHTIPLGEEKPAGAQYLGSGIHAVNISAHQTSNGTVYVTVGAYVNESH